MPNHNYSTVRELVSTVKYETNRIGRDTNTSNGFIYSLLKDERISLLNDEIKYNGYKRISEIKSAPLVLSMEEVPITEVEGECFTVLKTVKRSIGYLPSFLTFRNQQVLDVYSRDMSNTFTFINPQMFGPIYTRDKMLRKQSRVYWIDNNKLVIPNSSVLEVAIKYIPTEDLNTYKGSCETIMDRGFVIPNFMQKKLIENVVARIKGTKLIIPEDDRIDNIPNNLSGR